MYRIVARIDCNQMKQKLINRKYQQDMKLSGVDLD